MRLAPELAERVVAIRYEDLPPQAVYGSRIAVIDARGVALAGSREEAPQIVEAVIRELTALLEPARQATVASFAHARVQAHAAI